MNCLARQFNCLRLKGFPTTEDLALGVVIRYFADRGLVLTEGEAAGFAQEGNGFLTRAG